MVNGISPSSVVPVVTVPTDLATVVWVPLPRGLVPSLRPNPLKPSAIPTVLPLQPGRGGRDRV